MKADDRASEIAQRVKALLADVWGSEHNARNSCVLVCFSVVAINTRVRNNLWKKGLF